MKLSSAEALKQLIVIHHDRSNSYSQAANICALPELKELFTGLSLQSSHFSSELSSFVAGDNTSTAAPIIATDYVFTGAANGIEELLSESEFREEAATRTYDHVLDQEATFAEPLCSLIKKQRTELQKSHRLIRSLYFTF